MKCDDEYSEEDNDQCYGEYDDGCYEEFDSYSSVVKLEKKSEKPTGKTHKEIKVKN